MQGREIGDAMVIWQQIGLSIVPAILSGGGVWAYLKSRGETRTKERIELDDNAVEREKNDAAREKTALELLIGRLSAMEIEVNTIKREARVYRRISHDMSDFANSAQLLLVTEFYRVNEILIACGKPERYEDPVTAATDALKKLSQSIVGERQAIYDKAEAKERESEIEEKVTEVKKETIVKNGITEPK